MRIVNLSPMLFIAITVLTLSFSISALKRCQNCGQIHVPYPLSTAPNCGDQSYKIRCTAGTLFFDSINGSSYTITNINPTTQRFILHPPGLLNDMCVSADFQNEGMWLDTNSPFNITSSNTVIFLNCSQDVFTTLWNCSSSSICHKYVNDVAVDVCGARSNASQICCTVKTGGSVTAYRIRVRKERCAAYASFPNLDSSLPVSMWQPGVEIEWELPEEPPCNVNQDCLDLANSSCLPNPVTGGGRRCLCNSGFHWDSVNGICQSNARELLTTILYTY
ncbi:hypothetical protein VNO77_20392 [Canavalia gladiata]|uniref:Wall-associated receptor kinase galacturonan-binding domain-containing protein n=1 Tax=Canavalia gladiata TaxID=3824 RepID=A0AAN9QME0_CANGL